MLVSCLYVAELHKQMKRVSGRRILAIVEWNVLGKS